MAFKYLPLRAMVTADGDIAALRKATPGKVTTGAEQQKNTEPTPTPTPTGGQSGNSWTSGINTPIRYQPLRAVTADGDIAAPSKPKVESPSPSKTPTDSSVKEPTETKTPKPFSYAGFTYDDFSYGDFTYADYEESDAVKQALALLNQHVAGRPGAYSPVWQDEADAYLSRYQNRDPFAYDFNADALYQQYKDQYIQQGQLAMMDTMGQASAMTGGYGNSYAQTVGQQAFNQYLAQLNSVMPELYGMAYDRYTQEGQDLLDQYDLYMDREAQEYGRYQDKMDNWYRETERLTDRYDTERALDREDYESQKALAYDEHLANRELAYNEHLADREQAYDKYLTDREQAYNEYLRTYMGTDDGSGGTTPIDYTDLDYETQQKWGKEARNAKSWSGLTSVWNRMRISEHNPLSSAEFILDYARNNNITPTAADLDAFQKKLEKEGLNADEVSNFLGEWAMEFGLIEEKPYMPLTGGGGGRTKDFAAVSK